MTRESPFKSANERLSEISIVSDQAHLMEKFKIKFVDLDARTKYSLGNVFQAALENEEWSTSLVNAADAVRSTKDIYPDGMTAQEAYKWIVRENNRLKHENKTLNDDIIKMMKLVRKYLSPFVEISEKIAVALRRQNSANQYTAVLERYIPARRKAHIFLHGKIPEEL